MGTGICSGSVCSKYPFPLPPAPGDGESCSSGSAGITAACRPPRGLWEKATVEEKVSDLISSIVREPLGVNPRILV